MKGTACYEENEFVMEKFTDNFNHIGLSLRQIPPYVSDYIICVQALI